LKSLSIEISINPVVTHNGSGLAEVPALAFRQPGKLFKSSIKNKCPMHIRQPVYWQIHVVRTCFDLNTT